MNYATTMAWDDVAGPAPRPGTVPLVLSVFPSFAVGGAQVRFAALANRYGGRWRHAIVSLDGTTGCAERLRAEVPFALHLAPPRRGTAATLWEVRRRLRTLRPDVLLTSNWGAIEWAVANLLPPRIRHVHTEDGFGPDEAVGQKRRRMLARWLALRWSEVVLPSTVLLQAAREAWGLPEQQLHYVPNGLDIRRFHPDGLVATPPVPGAGPLIGTVAALRPEKNIGRLLRACALLRSEGVQLRLLIVGDGPERPGLEAMATALALQDCTRFAGHVSDPAALYRGLDVFALSSDTEQMPFSVMEAMASGLCVAATEVGDLRAMLAAENLAHVAPPGDAALAAVLRPLLVEPALRARLGAANRVKAARDYDEETMFARYAALIEG